MGLIVLIVLTAPIWIVLIFSLRVGLRALRFEPEHQITKAALRWIALNLCEPFVNFILIGLITFVHLQQSGYSITAWDSTLRTLPMIVLLLPALDLRAEHPIQRSIAAYALRFGIARWVFTSFIHLSMSNGQMNFMTLFFLIVIGTVLLWASAWWGSAHLRAIMRNESYAMLEARA